MSEEKDDFDRDAEALRDLIVKTGHNLREHCDSIVIIATLSAGADSQMIFDHRGNIYAVDGSISRFSEMRANQRKRVDEGIEP